MTSCEEVSDPEMVRILEEMLDTNQSITARAVARIHPSINHASSITRSSIRSQLLAEYQKKQEQYRKWRNRAPKISRDLLTAQVAQKDFELAQLKRQIEVLRAALLALILAVGKMGGMSKWLNFFADYRQIKSELDGLGVLPKAELKQFKKPQIVEEEVETEDETI
jgi:hypothetical protein